MSDNSMTMVYDNQINKKAIHHLFCRNCEISSFAKGRGEDSSEGIRASMCAA